MLAAQRASNQNANLPAGFWDEFAVRVRRDIPVLIDSIVPLYATHFSTAELTQLKAFYDSPIGRRLIAEQGPLQQESAQLGMRWGGRIGSQVAMDLMNRQMTEPNSQQP